LLKDILIPNKIHVITELKLENEAAEVDKKTVLDLCAHMFHLKDEDEKNDLKNE
jgi:hypothetical protein